MIVTVKMFSRAEFFSKSSKVVGHKSFSVTEAMRAEKSLPLTPVGFRSHSLTLLSPETGLRKAHVAEGVRSVPHVCLTAWGIHNSSNSEPFRVIAATFMMRCCFG